MAISANIYMSPGGSKPATYGRFKTSHSEARRSYQLTFICVKAKRKIFGGAAVEASAFQSAAGLERAISLLPFSRTVQPGERSGAERTRREAVGSTPTPALPPGTRHDQIVSFLKALFVSSSAEEIFLPSRSVLGRFLGGFLGWFFFLGL